MLNPSYDSLTASFTNEQLWIPQTSANAIADAPALVELDWYDATLNELYEMMELARQALEECSCEEINIPASKVVNNYYNEKDVLDVENIRKLIKETIKESTSASSCDTKIPDYSAKFLELENLIKNIKVGNTTISTDDLEKLKEVIKESTQEVIKETPVKVKCGDVNCSDIELKPEAIDKITERLTEQLPTIITNETSNNIVEKIVEKLPVMPTELSVAGLEEIRNILKEVNVRCEGNNCSDLDDRFDNLKNYMRELKQEPNKVEIPDIENHFDRLSKKLEEVIVLSLREEFVKETEKWTNNFREVVEKTDFSECDISEIKSELTKLKADFYLILEKSKTADNDAVLDMLNKILFAVNNIDVKVKIDNKSIAEPIRELKLEILDNLRKCCSAKNIDIEIPQTKDELFIEKEKHSRADAYNSTYEQKASNKQPFGCPKCGLDYGNCHCPKLVEEKIDRKILFDYAKRDERSPFHSN